MPSENATALARAVLLGDETAIAALIDCLQEDGICPGSTETGRLKDGVAGNIFASMLANYGSNFGRSELEKYANGPPQGWLEYPNYLAKFSYQMASILAAERARRLRPTDGPRGSAVQEVCGNEHPS